MKMTEEERLRKAKRVLYWAAFRGGQGNMLGYLHGLAMLRHLRPNANSPELN